jgi:hypothetical protein
VSAPSGDSAKNELLDQARANSMVLAQRRHMQE